MIGRAWIALALVTALASGARAQDMDLRVRDLPLPAPTSLHIRDGDDSPVSLRAAQADSAAPLARPGDDNPFELQERLRRQLSESDLVGQQRDLNDKVVFRFNLGYGLDDGKPSPCPPTPGICDPENDVPLSSGRTLGEAGYQRLRTYTFGDLVAGTRGLGARSLSFYFAAAFRFDTGDPISTAVPSVYDADDIRRRQVRSAYGEVEANTLFSNKWLKPFWFKAGRMYEYGAGIVQFDGVNFGYDLSWLSTSLWTGQRVSNWGFDYADLAGNDPEVPGFAAGWDVRLDFFRWRRWPLVVFATGMTFDDQDFGEQGIAYQYNRDISLRGSVRSIEGKAARRTLTLRARVSNVSTLFAEVDNRSDDDWVYDMLARETTLGGIDDPRAFLNLGKPLPRTMLRVRAGTVLFDAIDVLVSGAVAVEHAASDVAPSAFSATFLEGGAAFELRVRRAVRVGGSFDARVYKRDTQSLIDMAGPGTLLDQTGSFGERGFIQAGGRLQYSTGARGFTANTELYGRVYDHQSPYFETDELENEARVGGRFTVESWVGKQLRVKGIYDVSGALRYAPEITGLKTLRVMMEGTF